MDNNYLLLCNKKMKKQCVSDQSLLFFIKRFFLCPLFFFLFLSFTHGQQSTIMGTIYKGLDKEPVMYAFITIPTTSKGVSSDEDGNYKLELAPGEYTLQISCVGFKDKIIEGVKLKEGIILQLDIGLEAATELLPEVEVVVSPLSRKEKSPLSLRTVGLNEIQYNAGNANDVVRLLQAMPGISSPPGYSNALFVRGGGSFESRFFIDDVEMPVLNHFSEQGASGGNRSLLNSNLLARVHLYTSAFPANKGNALSGIFDFMLKEGNSEKVNGNLTVGSADLDLAIEGPLAKRANFAVSLRRSYLKPVLKLLNFPSLATYNDWHYKIKWYLTPAHHLSLIGIGAYDQTESNPGADDTELKRFILDNLRPYNQYNFVNAIKYTNIRKQNLTHVILSHYALRNHGEKYLNDDRSQPENLVENYDSDEGEIRFTFMNTQRWNDFKLSFGGEIGQVNYSTNSFIYTFINENLTPLGSDSDLNYYKWGAYIQIKQRLFNRLMLLSFGARVDATNYSSKMSNPLRQFSPRFSIAYALNKNTTVNFNTGIYYQLPGNLSLGYQDPAGNLVNRNSKVSYMSVTHMVVGMEWEHFNSSSKVNLEAFYKKYNQQPVSVEDQVALINKNFDFFRLGDEAIVSNGEGRAYGLELFYQQKLFKGFHGMFSYTLGWSEFKDRNGHYVASLADARHTLILSAGRHFSKKWHAGLKWRFQSNLPFTPYDIERSSRIETWNATSGLGVIDYELLNTQRMDAISELDIRIDKKFKFKKLDLTIFVDVLNVLSHRPNLSPFITVKRDNLGNPLVDPNNPLSYQTFLLRNNPNTFYPSFGIKLGI